MATAEQYAQWIVNNADKKGTPEFETVAQAYRIAKGQTQTGGTYKGAEVVQSTPDGGMVLRAPQGQLMFINKRAQFSSSDPEFIKQVMQGADPAELSRQRFSEDIVATAPVSAFAGKMAEGVPVVRGWLPQIAEQMGGPEAAGKVRASSAAMEEAYPKTSTGAQIAGAVAGSLPAAFAFPALPALAGLPPLARGLSYGGIGAATGALEGALAGAGEGKAGQGAIGGALGGFAGGVAAPLIGKGIEGIRKLVSRTDIPNISAALGISQDAAKVIKATFAESGTSVDDAVANIKKAGDLGMIADADVAAGVLLDAAAAVGGSSAQIARTAVNERAKEQSARMGQYLDESLSPLPRISGDAVDVEDMAADLAKMTSKQRREAYDRAYSTPIDYADESGRSIEELLKRIPDSFLMPAIRRANEKMQMAGTRNLQIMADIADDGTVRFIEMPNVQQLDEIKRALGEVAYGEIDSLGRPTARALDAAKLYRELRDTLSTAVPQYRVANDLAADKITLDNALELGEKIFTPRMSIRDVGRRLRGAAASELNVARLGARSFIQETLDNVKASITSPDVDINQLRKVIGDLSSDAAQRKMHMLIGKDEADRLFKNIDQAKMALALRAAVAENSKTAIRRTVREDIAEMTQPGVVMSMLRGQPLEAVRKASQAVTGATDEFTVEKQKKIFVDVARALTQMRGPDAAEAVRIIDRAIKGEKINQEQITQVMQTLTREWGTTSALLGGQAGAEQMTERY